MADDELDYPAIATLTDMQACARLWKQAVTMNFITNLNSKFNNRVIREVTLVLER